MQIRYLLILFLGITTLLAEAQPKINSPLSRYGLGDRTFYQSHHLGLMGGLYGGFNDENLVNLYNPAALGFLRSTAFDVGLSFGSSTLDVDEESDSYRHGGLDHLTLAFPMRNPISEVLERKNRDYSWAMALDLRNRTRIGYSTLVNDSLPDVGTLIRTYDGTGETYDFGWVNAFKYKDWSVGLDIGVMFGNVSTRRIVEFVERIDPLKDQFNDDISINGFRWNAGVQYRYLLNQKEENEGRKRYMTVGLYGRSNTGFSTNGTQEYSGVRVFTGVRDTLVNESEIEGEGTMPGVLGFGVVFEPSLKWKLGLNFETSDWTSYESDEFNTGDFERSYLLGLGGGYIPNPNAFGSYFSRVEYKFGLQYGRDGRVFNDESVASLQFNLGMTMPFYFLRQISHVHLGFQYRSITADIIKENYFGMIFSATFNDNSWFMKRKFN